MPLRIGFDLDGTLADFASAFHEVELGLFGPSSHLRAGEPEVEEAKETGDRDAGSMRDAGPGMRDAGEGPEAAAASPVPTAPEEQNKRRKADKAAARESRASRRRRDAVWDAIRSTPDFWTGLEPLDAGAVRRIHHLAIGHRWEVFFITQRPYTDGETVQRQTQRWLIAQGYDLPSVLVIGSSRGAAAGALRLDYHVDDNAQNCLDVISESRAKPILLLPGQDDLAIAQARRLKIGTAPTISEALDILEKVTLARTEPKLLERLASLVGWAHGSHG